MYQKSCKGSEKMSDVAIVRECAAPVSPGEGVNSQILRAANRLKWAYWRTFNAWYGKVQLSAEEREQARAVMLRNTRSREALRHEFQRNLQTIIGVAEAFARIDPSFHRNEIELLRGIAGETSGEDLA